MKQCPRCNQTYTDDTLNFCLNDGELLTMQQPSPGGFRDDPPTMVIDGARQTDPISWSQPQTAQPPAQWQHPSQQPQQQQFGGYPMTVAPNQSLAIVSICLGAAIVTIGWCCYLGVLLGPAAIITGIIAKSNIKKDPSRHTGNGLALTGIILGSAYFVGLILIIIIYGAAILLGGLK
ncbi:MAG: DUF4190 domain-containing protein [Acidobacteria bacterium]|nr:DUF4190 domain-containing protein [Acidobacteriota bacterium]